MKYLNSTGIKFIRLAILLALWGGVNAKAFAVEYTFTTLATFDGTQGIHPRSQLLRDASGNLYGTTEFGGEYGFGTVFKVVPDSGQVTTLATFDGFVGSNPLAGLVADASGNLYGTTSFGGDYGFGTVFKVAAGTNKLTPLASFDGTHGSNPLARLIVDASGNLYGTAPYGGKYGFGTVFTVAAGTNTLSTIADFDAVNGQFPKGGVIADASGNLYGTTNQGGAFGFGTVFKVAAGTNALTTLASFDRTAHGSNPETGLVADAAFNLYGTTFFGGDAGYGTVFKVAAGTNEFTRVVSFLDSNGSNPVSSLIVDASGNLFGTTQWDTLNNGTVFTIPAGSNSLTTLKLFDGIEGDEPRAGLISDPQGNLYGTTYLGGAYNYGIVFKLEKMVEPLMGDYNRDDIVDAADYILWRNTVGLVGPGLAADGNGDEKVDIDDYQIWKSHFGMVGGGHLNHAAANIPAPATINLMGMALLSLGALRGFRQRKRR